jgi:hypothetical protein
MRRTIGTNCSWTRFNKTQIENYVSKQSIVSAIVRPYAISPSSDHASQTISRDNYEANGGSGWIHTVDQVVKYLSWILNV